MKEPTSNEPPRTAPAQGRDDLTVVIPVFNEKGSAGAVITEWTKTLDRLSVDYSLRVYDDGSTDGTGELLAELARAMPRVHYVHHPNRGHGPTILRGYREARSDWILQIDSDREMPAEHFSRLWSRRHEYQFLIGQRQDRTSSLARRMVSTLARWVIRALLGRGPRDVNSPYRLMKRREFEPLFQILPDTVFAPNTLLSGLAARAGLAILEIPVPYRARAAGKPLASWRLWRGAFRSLFDALHTSIVARRRLSR